MLGIGDFWVGSAYLLCILSTLFCVIYSAVTWNEGSIEIPSQEDVAWAEEEDKLGERL